MLENRGKRGQAAIFIIVAIVLVAGVVSYFAFRGSFSFSSVPAQFVPIYTSYSECIKEESQNAVSLIGTQGGHLEIDSYDSPSSYAPFSSQLNFLGFPVPYWYYISGNGLSKEQVPTLSSMQNELSTYIAERLTHCNFENFYSQGYLINLTQPKVKVSIGKTYVDVKVNSPLTASKDDQSAIKSQHDVEIQSKLGTFYDTALGIYNKEKKEAFLENYSVDVLRLYTPVDGVEISCSGKVWKTDEVVNDLKQGLEANIGSLKFSGDYYSLNDQSKSYFVVNYPTSEPVNLIYSSNWPSRIEINGDGVSQQLMVAKPVGTQNGMGAMGFCYAPYHFVYDVSFPIMVQLYNNDEIFQFPMVVVIDNNLPRQSLSATQIDNSTSVDICNFNTQDVSINLYDTSLNPVDANISYTCLGQTCDLGQSKDGSFAGKIPSCFNGKLEATNEGYAPAGQIFSSNEETHADLILDRSYDVNVKLNVAGKTSNSLAIVSFVGNTTSSSVSLPEFSTAKLSEGFYDITVYVYGNSSIIIPASVKSECTEVAQGGIFGFFGGTKEQCFDINVPETKIDSALIGGGNSRQYITASQLEKGQITLNVEALPTPSTLEQLQNNYLSFDTMGVDLE